MSEPISLAVEEIIKGISEADEIEILEYNFDPCFQKLRDMAEEITRLRAQLGEDEGQEPVGYGYFHKETGQMDGWLEITEADSEGHAWPDTHEPKLLYTHPAPDKEHKK